MPSIFWMFVVASLVHIGEEYFFPGGFLQSVQRLNPWYTASFTVQFAIIVNSAFVLLVIVAAYLGERSLVFNLSIAALLLINSVVHLAATIFTRHYSPGVISGLMMYLPLSVTAFILYLAAGQVDITGIIFAMLLGLLYQLVPFVLIAATNRRTT